MIARSKLFGYLFVLYTGAHVGNVCYRFSLKNLSSLRLDASTDNRQAVITRSSLRGSGAQPHYIPWTNETKFDIIERALDKYVAHNKDEVDLPNGIGLRAVLRMADPMGGRESSCLQKYFRNWTAITDDIPRDPLFESFFEWLDYGEGKDIEVHRHCSHLEMDQSRHYMFTATQRALTEMDVDVDNKTGRIVNVTFVFMPEAVPDGMWLFVWGIDRKIYILDEEERDDRHFGHASFFAGRPVLLAGEMNITKNHTIEWISDSSGHYRPTLRHLSNFYKYLRDVKGVNVTTIEWRQTGKYDRTVALDPDWVDKLGQNQGFSSSRSYSRKVNRLSEDLRGSESRDYSRDYSLDFDNKGRTSNMSFVYR